MKTLAITLAIIAALIYGMLQLNRYYADRGACSWSLLGGGEYRHQERLDNAIEGLANDLVKYDKKARAARMQQQGKSKAEIDQAIKSLEPQYKREKEKMKRYCHLDFEKEPYFMKKSIVVKPSKYCEVGNSNNYDDNGYTGFGIEYNFDKESLKFFGSKRLVGIEYDVGSSPCETRYQGLGESGHFVVR